MLDKFKSLFKTKSLGNSLGTITRNYAEAPAFAPRRQVVGITYKAIDKIGLSLSTYEMQVKKRNGDAFENHPLMALFNQPNPNQNASDFIYLYGMQYEIYGETFWYKASGQLTGKPKELYLLPPDKVEVKVVAGEFVGYVLHKENGQQVPFAPEEILHDKRPNPFNEWRGMSVIERAAAYVDTEINITNFTLNYMRNNASPAGIVSLPDMERDAFKQFAMQWRESHEGPANAGKTAFVRGETKFQAVGATLKDLDVKVIHDMSQDDVLMMLDVPKPLLGITVEEGFGRSSVEALNYIFASEKLEPMMRRLDRIWEQLGKELLAQPIEIGHESPVPEDKQYMLERHKEGVNKWLTVNEIREQEGLPPIKGGDEIKEPTPPNFGNQPPPPAKSIRVTRVSKAKQLNDEQEAFRKELVDTNEAYVLKFRGELGKFLTKQEKKVIANLKASQKAFEEVTFSIKEEAEAMAALLTPIVIELMDDQAAGVANFITGELLTVPPELRATVEQHITQISGVFNQDTITALERTLTEGQTAGASLTKLTKRVENVYSDASGYRAERIARTETLKASNRMAEAVYKENGYTQVQWFINPGACEFCRAFAGKTKTIGGNFSQVGDVITGAEGNQMSIAYDDIATPPLHPNCTCSLIPVGN